MNVSLSTKFSYCPMHAKWLSIEVGGFKFRTNENIGLRIKLYLSFITSKGKTCLVQLKNNNQRITYK